ncbi:hypothetical protein BJX99DRAFT_254660 [Aspergillus californicus]
MAACPAAADAIFGPRIDVACRTFDFTIYFEDAFFACLPSAIFIILLPVAFANLRSEYRRVQRSALLACKLVALNALLVCQLAFVLARQVKLSSLQSDVPVSVDVLELVAIAGAVALSYIHHSRSIRPSTLLVCFLSARSLLGIARVRTLWLMPNATRAANPFVFSFALNLSSTVLESLSKESNLVEVTEKPATPEPFSGFWKRATLAWLAGTFRQGYSKVISVRDLPELDPKLDSEVVARQLRCTWDQADKTARHALLRVCLYAYRSPLFAAVLPRLLMTGFTFCQPFLITATVTWVGNPDASMDSGKALIGAFALVHVGQAVFTSLYGYQTARQTVNTPTVDLGETTAITLMGTDVERIVNGFKYFHELWASLLDIAIAIYLLERQVGVACRDFFVSATFKLSAATNKYQRLWIERIEERLRLTSYTLEIIKAVKMLGLSEKLYSIIKHLRYIEIATSAVFRKLLIVTITLSNSPANLAPMVTFVVYIIIALVRHDRSLLATQAFTSLSLVSLVTTPVLTFIQALPAMVQCLGCFNRIQEYCCPGEWSHESETAQRASIDKPGVSSSLTRILKPPSFGGKLVEFSNLSVGWDKDATLVLRDIDLTIQHGSVTMIVGPVGSGKSTLLESILGESLILQGRVSREYASIAYCSQTPWLQSTDIQHNILGDSPLDSAWYATVLHACGLESDLAHLPRGDQTPVGSNGLALSGGQKQRIALAWALYSRCKVVLLDDVFSGIDARSILRYADQVVVLADGGVTETGSLSALQSSNSYIQDLKTAPANASVISDEPNETAVEGAAFNHPDEHMDIIDPLDHAESIDSTRQNGDSSVYGYYASVSGRTTAVPSIITTLCWCFCREFSTIWLNWWTEANAKHPNSKTGMYLGVYIFFGIFGMLLMIAACWLVFVRIISKSALQLHDDLMISTMRAPLQFFNKVDIGSITNRFSQDMDLMDMTLPLERLITLAAACSCLVKVVILAVFAK